MRTPRRKQSDSDPHLLTDTAQSDGNEAAERLHRQLRTAFTLARPVTMPTEAAGAFPPAASVLLRWLGDAEVGRIEGLFAVLLLDGFVRALAG